MFLLLTPYLKKVGKILKLKKPLEFFSRYRYNYRSFLLKMKESRNGKTMAYFSFGPYSWPPGEELSAFQGLAFDQ